MSIFKRHIVPAKAISAAETLRPQLVLRTRHRSLHQIIKRINDDLVAAANSKTAKGIATKIVGGHASAAAIHSGVFCIPTYCMHAYPPFRAVACNHQEPH
jgi:hypothetical protein